MSKVQKAAPATIRSFESEVSLPTPTMSALYLILMTLGACRAHLPAMGDNSTTLDVLELGIAGIFDGTWSLSPHDNGTAASIELAAEIVSAMQAALDPEVMDPGIQPEGEAKAIAAIAAAAEALRAVAAEYRAAHV